MCGIYWDFGRVQPLYRVFVVQFTELLIVGCYILVLVRVPAASWGGSGSCCDYRYCGWCGGCVFVLKGVFKDC